MNAAILAITPHPPKLAFAAWLAGAGLSVCGVFIVQYFPIKAFSMTDEEFGLLIDGRSSYAAHVMLAVAAASPVIITLWASVLFATGIVDYAIQADLGGRRYKVLALTPVCIGIAAALATLVAGELVGRRIDKRVRHWSALLLQNPEKCLS